VRTATAHEKSAGPPEKRCFTLQITGGNHTDSFFIYPRFLLRSIVLLLASQYGQTYQLKERAGGKRAFGQC